MTKNSGKNRAIGEQPGNIGSSINANAGHPKALAEQCQMNPMHIQISHHY